MTKLVHVAAAVITDGKRVLLARRPEHVHQGGKLEFPGGKVEAGESVQQALQRELQEELDITPQVYEPLIKLTHRYPDKSVCLDVWRVTRFGGEPRGVEGQEIFWRALDQLTASDFPAANVPIIAAARLPRQLAVSPSLASLDESGRLHGFDRALLAAGLGLLRCPAMDRGDYARLLEERHLQGCLVHGDIELAQKHGFGLHLPSKMLSKLTERPVGARKWFSASVHNIEEIRQAEALGADFLVLGNVCETASHPGRAGMGWERFAALVEATHLPVYAIGGMCGADLERAIAAGAQGVAGISMFME